MLGSPILYFKGRRRMMFQLSGFCYRVFLFLELRRAQAALSFLMVPPKECTDRLVDLL